MRDIREGGSGDITVCMREAEHKARAGCSHQVHGCIKGVIHRSTVGAGSEYTARVPEKKKKKSWLFYISAKQGCVQMCQIYQHLR